MYMHRARENRLKYFYTSVLFLYVLKMEIMGNIISGIKHIIIQCMRLQTVTNLPICSKLQTKKKNPISIITFCFIFNFEVILRRNCKLLGTEVNLVLLSWLNSQVSDYGQYNYNFLMNIFYRNYYPNNFIKNNCP